MHSSFLLLTGRGWTLTVSFAANLLATFTLFYSGEIRIHSLPLQCIFPGNPLFDWNCMRWRRVDWLSQVDPWVWSDSGSSPESSSMPLPVDLWVYTLRPPRITNRFTSISIRVLQLHACSVDDDESSSKLNRLSSLSLVLGSLFYRIALHFIS